MEQIITYKTLKFRRRFGIEIEVNKTISKASIVKAIEEYSNHSVHSFSYGKSINNKLWHVKFDITCGEDEEDADGGWEVASFVGHTPQDIIHMGDVATVLKDAGAKVNRFCGFHIHAEATDMLPHQVGVMLAYWIKIEKVLTNLIPFYRSFEHCELLNSVMESMDGPRFRNRHYSPQELYNYFIPIAEEDEDDPMDYRYRAINIINYHLALNDRRRKRRTLELRLPESTLESDNIIGWLRLYLNFIEYTKDAAMPENLLPCDLREALTYLGLNHDRDTFYLFGPSLNKTRIWFLQKLIKNLQYPSKLQKMIKEDAKKLLKEVKI